MYLMLFMHACLIISCCCWMSTGLACVPQAFTAGYNTPKDNLRLLEDLVGTRYEMAELMGALSFAHYTLSEATLAGSPEAVESFLQELLAAIQPKVTLPFISPHDHVLQEMQVNLSSDVSFPSLCMGRRWKMR